MMRVWHEQVGEDQFEWRAYIRHVLSGEACYIRRWRDLVNFLNTLEETEMKK
jgi:hypothetical protein